MTWRNQLQLIVMVITFGFILAQDREAWMKSGAEQLQMTLRQRPNVGVAKNVILFVGDGMGVSTVTATRILMGQNEGYSGEEYRLHFEKMPYTGIVKTYNTNQQTPDSAGTATAFLSGVKTRSGTLGVDQRVEKGDCTYLEEGSLDTMVDWALAEGKSVGIVTTARVTHATPGAAYAKIPHREWESDADIVAPWYGSGGRNCDLSSLKDIARQLVEDNHRIHVVMGGGRRALMTNKTTDPVYPDKVGKRTDGRDLIKLWESKQEEKGARYKYVWNREQLREVDDNVDHLLGLFDYSHMAYDAERYESGPRSQPSLSEMTEKAIKILRKNEKGFFLFVEGAAIDLSHHFNLAHKALLEGIALDRAVKTATAITSERDTLTMVTADHSHVFNIAGYPVRGHPILATMDNSNEADWYMPTDKKVFTTLSYGNGPGPNRTVDLTNADTGKMHPKRKPRKRASVQEMKQIKSKPMTTIVYGNGPGAGGEDDLTHVDTSDLNFQFPAAVPIDYETHGGEDVTIYAQGPMAHLLSGNWEQHYIAHVMAYASCVGPDKSHCTAAGRELADFCNVASGVVLEGRVGLMMVVVVAAARQLLLL